MTKYILIFCGLFIAAILSTTTINSQNKNSNTKKTETMWKEIDALMSKGSINSAQKKLETLKNETPYNNEKEQLRIKIYELALSVQYNSDLTNLKRNGHSQINQSEYKISLLNAYKNVNKLHSELKDSTLQAVSSFFMAQILAEYSDPIRRSKRSEVEEENRTEDISEWSYKEIIKLAEKHIEDATADLESLANIKCDDLSPLFFNNGSKELNSVADAIGIGCVDIYDDFYSDEILSYARDPFNSVALYTPFNLLIIDKDAPKQLNLLTRLIKIHQQRGEEKATIALDLLRLDYYEGPKVNIIPALDSLIAAYPNEEAIVPAYILKYERLIDYDDDDDEREHNDNIPYPINYKEIEDEALALKKKFPNSKDLNGLDDVIKQLHHRKLETYTSPVIQLGDDLEIRVHNTNIESLNFQLFKIDAPIATIQRHSYDTKWERYYTPIKLKTNTLKLSKSNYLKKAIDTFKIKTNLDYGFYALEFSDKNGNGKVKSTSYFMVSDLNMYAFATDKDSFMTVVVNSKTGAPINDAKVEIFENKTLASQQTDNDGFSHFYNTHSDRSWEKKIYAYRGKDFTADGIYIPRLSKANRYDNYHIEVFTDRNIYRPLQTIKFKAIAYNFNEENHSVWRNKKVLVTLYDANHQKVHTITTQTDAFGSITGEIPLKEGALLGLYSLEAQISPNNDTKYITIGSANIRVEEYKRPTFEVIFDEVKDSYQFDNPITITGKVKGLSGEAIANCSVNLNISKHYYTFWMSGRTETKERQTVKTDADGIFSLTFTPNEKKKSEKTNNVVRYYIEAEATIPSGETQRNEMLVWVADYDLRLSIGMPSIVEKSSENFYTITAHTYNGTPQNVNVEVAIAKLDNEDNENIIYTQTATIQGEGKFAIPKNKLTPGTYKLIVKALSNNKYACSSDNEFIFYDKNSKTMPNDEPLWTDKKSVTLNMGESADLIIGSACKDAHLLEVIINRERKVISKRWINLSNEITKVAIKADNLFKANQKIDCAMVKYYLVKNNQFHELEISIYKKLEDLNLKFSLASFRDKTTPGAKETWTLKFDSLPSQAEVMCGMYDASLDAYSKTLNWPKLNREEYPYLYLSLNRLLFHYSSHTSYYARLYSTWNFIDLEENKPLWYNLVNMPTYKYAATMAPTALRSANLKAEAVSVGEVDEADASYDTLDKALGGKVSGVEVVGYGEKKAELTGSVVKMSSDETMPKPHPALRQNFSELAFFYPQLLTEKDGTVSFSFTMPDALTRWNFTAYAHTQDLHNGILKQTITTQLPFALKPTLPRFVRIGDKQHLSASINNISGEKRDVEVQMILSDAETGKEIKSDTKKLQLDEKQTVVDFEFTVPDKISAIDVKLFAVSDNLSDGEQHQLAVLPRGMRINKSVNIIAKKGESKSVSLSAIEKEAENKEITLEYSANAAWNALMAMPKVSYNTENAIDMALALYANGLSQDIGEKHPELKSSIEQWQKTEQGAQRSSSPLEQNAELKNILLNETPWVMEAKRESEWIKDIANTLDPQRAKNDNQSIMEELQKLQNNDGGFAWRTGMSSSLFTSICVAEQLSRLNSLGLLNKVNGGKKMLQKLLPYLDNEVVKDYHEQKKHSSKLYVGEWHAHLMMIRLESNDIKAISHSAKTVYNEYEAVIKKEWRDFTLYGKACLALAMKLKGETKLAQEIVNNLRETLSTDENGAKYWRSNIDSWNWYGSEIRSHAMAMIALAKVNRNQAEQDDLSLWLLLRKRTTLWEGTAPTIDAISAIINANSDGIKSMVNPAPSTLVWGDQTISTAGKNKETVGEQYIKNHISAQDFKENLTSLSVTQSKDVPGYGALYIGYDCPYDAIKSAKSGISVEKKTYLCKTAEKGETHEVLSAIKNGQKLKVGDKIKVLLSINVEQTLDFVCLKDLRAACCEPEIALSGYYLADNTYCYRSFTDSSVRFFFDRLQKGTYVFEYTMHVTHKGTYSAGVATVQCQYAPSYQGNSSNGVMITVE